MKLKITSIIVLLMILIPAPLDGKSKARIYDLKTGEVFTAQFTGKWGGTGHGKITLDLRGKKLVGEYSTVPHGATGWGTILTAAGMATASGGAVSARQEGQAIATGDGEVVQCEYVVSAWTAHGSGACKDQEGNLYKLMF